MFQNFIESLAAQKHIGVIAHFRPDGDALGSTIALGLALQSMGKQVTMYNEDPLPPLYRFLEGSELIQPVPDSCPEELDMLICLDNGSWKRLGDRAIACFAHTRELTTRPLLANIDHHGSNELYGQINIVDSQAAATGCLIFDLLQLLNVKLTPAIANALYTAISTDTGSFQYGSTTPKVMRMAADLIEAGVDVHDINRRLYQEVALSTIKVNRDVLNHMVIEHNGELSHYSISPERMRELGVNKDDTKDTVEMIRGIEGVKVSIIFEDLEDGQGRCRMSLRSKDTRINVAQFAEQFGGGGHAMAAGIRMKGSLADCRERVLTAMRDYMKGALV